MLLLASVRAAFVIAMTGCLAVVGCGGGEERNAAPGQRSAGEAYAPVDGIAREARTSIASKKEVASESSKSEDPKRMILYSATVEVIVKDLDVAREEITKLVQQNKAYVAGSEVRGNTGSARSATFTIRVPVENFGKLKDALLALGVQERDMIKSDDVTEEFYDLQGRLKNLRSSQERLLELKKDASVKEILEIEPQLERVNEKIEQIEGRLKYLTTFAALSTINLSMREIKDYKPPTSPTFGDRISRTFSNSWDGLVNFGEGFVLFLVALGPWLPVLVPCVAVGVWLVRRMLRGGLRPLPSVSTPPANKPPAT